MKFVSALLVCTYIYAGVAARDAIGESKRHFRSHSWKSPNQIDRETTHSSVSSELFRTMYRTMFRGFRSVVLTMPCLYDQIVLRIMLPIFQNTAILSLLLHYWCW